MTINEAIVEVCHVACGLGGRALLVGGAVRDRPLDIRSKDFDIEVYGVEANQLIDALKGVFELDLVGQSFGIAKLKAYPIDVSLPRRESKYGVGHKDFAIEADPRMTIREAAERRDFTINSMAENPLTGEFFDYFGGADDLKNKILRHTSVKFTEDPLRVLRGMQFIARFGLDPDLTTIALCNSMGMEWLSAERIYEEWNKLLLKGNNIGDGLRFLYKTGWMRFFPEIAALKFCPQDAEWHPEGDVFEHTCYCLDAFAKYRTDVMRDDLVVGYATLLHDTGKPQTTEFIKERWHAYGHEEKGREPTTLFMARMMNQPDVIKDIVTLVVNHMTPDTLYRNSCNYAAVRRLANKVGRIDLLCRLVQNDREGRPPLIADLRCIDWLLEQAKQLQITQSKPQAIVMGRHLIGLGLKPSRVFREILNACFEAQLDGKFITLEEGINLAQTKINEFNTQSNNKMEGTQDTETKREV